MIYLVAILLLVCIVYPLALSWRVLRLDEPSRAAWLIVVGDAAAFIALIMLVGRWDIAGTYTRYLLLAVFLSAVAWSLRKHATRPWCKGSRRMVFRRTGTSIVSLVIFGGALGYVLHGMMPPSRPYALAFPLKDGVFMVAHGGAIRLLNHHAGHSEQQHAADITAINGAGFRAGGILPADLNRYAIYGESVISPCSGRIIAARGDLPDLVPPETDRDNPAGNHVIVDCGAVHVELAHLQQGSVHVAAGDRIDAGADLGKVGNSGNTTEPHLHIHAFDPDSHVGVPIVLDGRPPVRNRLFAD